MRRQDHTGATGSPAPHNDARPAAATAAVEIRLLGPFEAEAAGRPVRVTGHLRTLLATLALSAGHAVTIDRLTTALWCGGPPRYARRTVQTYLSRLRTVVGADAISTGENSYVFEADPDHVDALRFTRLLNAAAQAPDRQTERARLAQALALWRGAPLSDVSSGWLAAVVVPQLVERHLAALENRIDLDVAEGRTRHLVAELEELTAGYPLRESLWVRLLVVLSRCGRQAEALARYEEIRKRLAGELGADPGAELQRIYADLLAGRVAEPVAGDTLATPHQLPAPPAVFTGRERELAVLQRVDGGSQAAAIVIDGMAGIGKTALAVMAAHLVADRFPDGQLGIDLNGHAQGRPPVEPGEALDRLLGMLGITGERVPLHVDDRAALYRSCLAGRRMLILLDNAAAEWQVRPLLPGASGSVALITSRHRLTGLDGAGLLSLDTLPEAEAVTLLQRTVGVRGRPVGRPQQLAEVVRLCGGLPLAIRIAGARLRAHPAWTAGDLIDRLRDHRHPLVGLEAGDRSVTAALDLSYQQLPAAQQRAYRRLGLGPAVDVDPYAAAALTGGPVSDARRWLDDLLDANLLQEPAAGRYRFHDLVRAHAVQTATAADDEPARQAALIRLLRYYAHTASVACGVAYPCERGLPVPEAVTPVPALADVERALLWLDTELTNLLTTARFAVDHGWPEHTMRMSVTLHRYLTVRARYADAEALHTRAVAAARAAGDRGYELRALTGLGNIHLLQRRQGHATDDFQRALVVARAAGDRSGEQFALTGLGDILRLDSQHDRAAEVYREALGIARAIGDRSGEQAALHGLGWLHLMQGPQGPAVGEFERALAIARDTGDHAAELNALRGLAWACRHAGRLSAAADRLDQALAIARAAGDRAGELDAVRGRGHIWRGRGQYDRAAEDFGQALTIALATGHRTGELDALTGLGAVHRHTGQYAQAEACLRRVCAVAQEVGDRNWEYEGVQGLGRVYHATDRAGDAIKCHRQALEIAVDIGVQSDQARAHDGLAYAHLASGRRDRAAAHWQLALDLLESLRIEHTDDEETTPAAIRTQLGRLAAPPSPQSSPPSP